MAALPRLAGSWRRVMPQRCVCASVKRRAPPHRSPPGGPSRRPGRPGRGHRAAGDRTQALRRAEQRLCQAVLLDAPAAGSVAVGTRRARSALGHAQRALQGDAGRARSPAACAEAPSHQLHPLVESASRARGRVISRSSGEAGRSEAAWGPPSKVPTRQAYFGVK